MELFNDISADELAHWDHDYAYPQLLRDLSDVISEHFADYYSYAEEGAAASAARREWVRSLTRTAETLSDVSWDASWVESWSAVLGAARDAYAQDLEGWREEVARARSDRAEILALARSEHIPPPILEHILSRCDKTIDSAPPAEPALDNDHHSVKRLARRGFVAEQLSGVLQEARERANRAMDLLDLLRNTQHSQNLRLYLHRCGRSYVLGAYPEVCVLCAAAIELRLSEVIDTEDAVARLALKGEWELTLGRKLKYAARVRLIPRSLDSELRWLVASRNDVMHFSVGLDDSRGSALRALRLLAAFLRQFDTRAGA